MAPPPPPAAAGGSSNRRAMRRTRVDASQTAAAEEEAAAGLMTPLELYAVQGDAPAALQAWKEQQQSSESDETPRNSYSSSSSTTWQYNRVLLDYLVNGLDGGNQSWQTKNDLLARLAKVEADLEEESSQAQQQDLTTTGALVRKRQRNQWIRAYNRALVLFAAGDTRSAAAIANEIMEDMILNKTLPPPEGSGIASRLAFLLLECILATSVGVHSKLQQQQQGDEKDDDDETNNALGTPPVHKILEWLEFLDTSASSSDSSSDKKTAAADPQLKFLLALYKSRMDVMELDEATGYNKHVDAKVRSARKEMKTAMEVFQHKLRSSFGAADTLSVVSSANSEENSQVNHQSEPQPPKPSSMVLQKHNQSALNLKANLEQLKGNTKKSLILCSEAAAAAVEDPYYNVVHANNLGVVYETNKKLHLALHSLGKGLLPQTTADDNQSFPPPLFASDGTARPDPTGYVLYNAAICSLQARQYRSAYECMARCLGIGTSFTNHNRSRCWLHVAQACIGIYSGLKVANGSKKFTIVQARGNPAGLLLNNLFCSDSPIVNAREALVRELGSPEDLEQVKRNPLLRARAALELAISKPEELGTDALMSARLTLSYVLLAFREYRDALKEAKLVLESSPQPPEGAGDMARRLHRRCLASARLYAAEACCALDETTDAMKFLVGDGQEDAFDRLAFDLSGVTLETAANNTMGKRRLAHAQSAVRSSASTVSATMGNLAAAKKLAMSAQAMEDASSPNRERSAARRALVYCLLLGGNHGAALTILQSLR